MEKYYSVQELSVILSVTPPTIYRLIHNGMLQAEQWAGRICIPESAIEEYRLLNKVQPQKKRGRPPKCQRTKIAKPVGRITMKDIGLDY